MHEWGIQFSYLFFIRVNLIPFGVWKFQCESALPKSISSIIKPTEKGRVLLKRSSSYLMWTCFTLSWIPLNNDVSSEVPIGVLNSPPPPFSFFFLASRLSILLSLAYLVFFFSSFRLLRSSFSCYFSSFSSRSYFFLMRSCIWAILSIGSSRL